MWRSLDGAPVDIASLEEVVVCCGGEVAQYYFAGLWTEASRDAALEALVESCRLRLTDLHLAGDAALDHLAVQLCILRVDWIRFDAGTRPHSMANVIMLLDVVRDIPEIAPVHEEFFDLLESHIWQWAVTRPEQALFGGWRRALRILGMGLLLGEDGLAVNWRRY
jgi:hypothetical protein